MTRARLKTDWSREVLQYCTITAQNSKSHQRSRRCRTDPKPSTPINPEWTEEAIPGLELSKSVRK